MSLNEQSSRKIEIAGSATVSKVAQDELADRLTGASQHRSYHELGDHHVVERDVLEQLRYNLNQLEEVHQRFAFMMGELGTLIGVPSAPSLRD